jgi:hypothetical protein
MPAFNPVLQQESQMSLPPKIKPAMIVNAYLFYAQRLLQFQKEAPHIMSDAAHTMSDADSLAYSAGISLCLKQAWEAWLDELGRYLNKQFTGYSDLLMPGHRELAEVDILLNLSRQQDSWLAKLLSCFEPWIKTSESERTENEAEFAGRIDLVQIDADSPKALVRPASAEHFAGLIGDFKEYIRQVRTRQEEW